VSTLYGRGGGGHFTFFFFSVTPAGSPCRPDRLPAGDVRSWSDRASLAPTPATSARPSSNSIGPALAASVLCRPFAVDTAVVAASLATRCFSGTPVGWEAAGQLPRSAKLPSEYGVRDAACPISTG